MFPFNKVAFTSIKFLLLCGQVVSDGILYPRESESREVKSLDGIWHFRTAHVENQDSGFQEKWFQRPLHHTGEVELMPVPSSFNDITQSAQIRDHVGWVWYETSFRVPTRWIKDERKVFLRFGNANRMAVVWVNGEHAVNHTGGYLPFEADISKLVIPLVENLLVVAINNTLTAETIPQGTLHYPNDPKRYPKHYMEQSYNFDYFNFAGIHRPVYLYTTPLFRIDDISIRTTFQKGNQIIGLVDYTISYKWDADSWISNLEEKPTWDCLVIVRDKKNHKIALSRTCSGVIDIPGVKLWWPHLSQPEGELPGYLYTLEVHLFSSSFPGEEDVYRQKFGVRTIQWTNSSFSINEKPFYFRGFGRHEDYNIRGRGVDLPMLIKDHNLIKWTGANSYRTSHYPYAEEILDLTDELGIVVIDESPAIGLSGFNDKLKEKHAQVMKELVRRDKNRPSVIMWSIGNEPKSLEAPATAYFNYVINVTRLADIGGRPITIVVNQGFSAGKAPNLDVIGINRYFAWYSNTGRKEVIHLQMPSEVAAWHAKYGKPILVTEYGAGAVAGMHQSPGFVWTEDYQVEYLKEHFKAFDFMRSSPSFPYFIGEMIWNFADFATPQETFRPWGCMKGIFTRERQPKRAAHVVRKRYWALALDQEPSCVLPKDLEYSDSGFFSQLL